MKLEPAILSVACSIKHCFPFHFGANLCPAGILHKKQIRWNSPARILQCCPMDMLPRMAWEGFAVSTSLVFSLIPHHTPSKSKPGGGRVPDVWACLLLDVPAQAPVWVSIFQNRVMSTGAGTSPSAWCILAFQHLLVKWMKEWMNRELICRPRPQAARWPGQTFQVTYGTTKTSKAQIIRGSWIGRFLETSNPSSITFRKNPSATF